MAGIEKLEIHSKSYLVRWVEVSAGSTLSWSVQPHKKSINFGVFKHPGKTGASGTSLLTSALSQQFLNTPRPDQTNFDSEDEGAKLPRRHSGADSSTVVEKLEKLGLKTVVWLGKFEADRVNMGKYDVLQGEDGMYGLVLDNTFSKTTSKTVTFVLMTYPTNAPPKTPHHMYQAQMMHRNSSASIVTRSPGLQPINDSNESLAHSDGGNKLNTVDYHHGSVDMESTNDANLYTGMLSKKRRKRNQGYARRFFSLDFTSSTLSYYKNRNSSALRGAIPLSLAAVGTS